MKVFINSFHKDAVIYFQELAEFISCMQRTKWFFFK